MEFTTAVPQAIIMQMVRGGLDRTSSLRPLPFEHSRRVEETGAHDRSRVGNWRHRREY
jgi:hypothetical protein